MSNKQLDQIIDNEIDKLVFGHTLHRYYKRNNIGDAQFNDNELKKIAHKMEQLKSIVEIGGMTVKNRRLGWTNITIYLGNEFGFSAENIVDID